MHIPVVTSFWSRYYGVTESFAAYVGHFGRWVGQVTGVLVSGPNRAVVGELVNSIDVAVVNGNQQITITYQNDDSNVLTRVITVPMTGTSEQVDVRSARYVYLYKYSATQPAG